MIMFETILEAKDRLSLAACYPVMRELRPQLSEDVFIEQVLRQHTQGYHLIYLKAEEAVFSVLGYRLTERLAWGKSLYIDDFATLSSARGQGYGERLMAFILDLAREEKCQELHLDTGPDRHAAHRFYLNQGFEFRAYHLRKVL